MIAGMVVPLGSCSIVSTTDCLDDEDAGDFNDAAFEGAAFDAAVGFGRGETLLLVVRFAARDDLRAVFADFDFDLRVAIWVSLGVNDSMCCHWHGPTNPRAGREESENRSLFARQAVEQRGGVLQTTSLINQLFDIH
jgi:hypothetical protein